MSTWSWPTLEQHPPLAAETVLALLPMIGLENAWRTKAGIVGYIGSYVGGCYVGGPELGEWMDLSAGRTRVLLAELAAERVILRDAGRAKHPRHFWVELHPNIAGWRRVPWKVSDFELRRRLSDHALQAVDPLALESATEAAKYRLDARPMGARLALANARLMTARWARQEEALTRANGPRDEGGGGGSPTRGHRARDTRGGLRAATRRASRPTDAPVVVFPAGEDGSSTSTQGVRQPAAAIVDRFELDQVVGAVMRRAHAGPNGRKFMADKLREELAQLIVRYQAPAVLEVVVTLPDRGQQVPAFVRELGAELAGGAGVSTAVDQAAERRKLEAAIANRRGMLDVYVRTEADPELIESCRAELTACETRLAELERQEGAA